MFILPCAGPLPPTLPPLKVNKSPRAHQLAIDNGDYTALPLGEVGNYVDIATCRPGFNFTSSMGAYFYKQWFQLQGSIYPGIFGGEGGGRGGGCFMLYQAYM